MNEEKLLWTHHDSNIDSRGMGMLGDRLFYYVPGRRLACLDRNSGSPLWTNDQRETMDLIEAEAHGLPGTPGFRTAALTLATPVGLFLQGQKRANVVAFGLTDGEFLWSRKKFHNNPNMLYVGGQLLISGIENNGAVQVLDPATGATTKNLNFWKGSCARLTGSPEALFCRGEGFGRFDLASQTYTAERSARPGCNDGVLAANGLLYVGPWLCDCNLAILGQMALGSAHTLDAQSQTVTADQVERIGHTVREPGDEENEVDWPTYRHDSSRSAATPAQVPSSAKILWQWKPDLKTSLTPSIAVGSRIYLAGDDGRVSALDRRTGTLDWSHVTGGPILAAPTFWRGRILVGSGDGYVYCLDARDGKLIWRFRVAPVERRMMVYGKLCSTWPVNSGVVVHNHVAYAAAGIMFRDGTHVVALDANSGELKWHNGSTGRPLNARFELQAASAQGGLAVGAGRLWLASGNVVAPTSFDLQTGEARVVPAQRIPVWNSVMAQKPEPGGRDVLVFQDRMVLHGGRLLYSGKGQVVTAAQVNYRLVDEKGQLAGPSFTPVRHSALAPTWDDQVFVTLTSRYGDVVAWPTSVVHKQLGSALKTMVDMDRDVPGEQPEKWGQYNQIGRIFGAVERQLRTSSQWPQRKQQVYAMNLTKNALVMLGRPVRGSAGWYAAAYDKKKGGEVWSVPLPAEPELDGLCVDRDGNVLVTLNDGRLICIGGP